MLHYCYFTGVLLMGYWWSVKSLLIIYKGPLQMKSSQFVHFKYDQALLERRELEGFSWKWDACTWKSTSGSYRRECTVRLCTHLKNRKYRSELHKLNFVFIAGTADQRLSICDSVHDKHIFTGYNSGDKCRIVHVRYLLCDANISFSTVMWILSAEHRI